jgi:hypothetical protein
MRVALPHIALLSTREGDGKENGRVRKEIFKRGGVDGV